MHNLITRLRDTATAHYGLHTREGRELTHAADMLERVQATDPMRFAEASQAVAVFALAALNVRSGIRDPRLAA